MAHINQNFRKLPGGYLFPEIGGGQVQGGGSVRLNYRVGIAHGHGDGFVLPVPPPFPAG